MITKNRKDPTSRVMVKAWMWMKRKTEGSLVKENIHAKTRITEVAKTKRNTPLLLRLS